MNGTSPKKSDLGVRAMSAVVMVTVASTALWLGGWVWTVFVAAVALGVLWEWIGLTRALARSPVARGLWNAAGIAYIGFASLMLLLLRSKFLGIEPVLIVIVVVVAVDIGAYFAGRTFGGPKIAPKISPSKTWSGLIGGAILASLVCAAIHPSEALWKCIQIRNLCEGDIGQLAAIGWYNIRLDDVWLGPVIAVIAQAGDFFESWMKRRAGVKDSGKLIPGHGGLFDRVDGLLAVLFVLGILSLVFAGFQSIP